jgi:hypothetical protein
MGDSSDLQKGQIVGLRLAGASVTKQVKRNGGRKSTLTQRNRSLNTEKKCFEK